MAQKEHDNDEVMVLAHDAVRGYRPAFYIAITIGTLYLAYIFIKTW